MTDLHWTQNEKAFRAEGKELQRRKEGELEPKEGVVEVLRRKE